MGLVSLALALFVPGFDAPNYYSALALAIVGGLVMGPVGAIVARRALARGDNPFVAALGASLAPSLLPLAVLLVNGVRVQQCDVLAGVWFYLLGPPLSCAFAAIVGAACASLHRLHRVSVPAFYAVWLVWAAADLWHLYSEPAIFLYNPFAGFFSGAVYDAVIEIDARIALYRLNNLAQALALVALVRLMWDRARGRITFAAAQRAPIRRWVAALVAVAVTLVFWSSRATIGYEIARADIEERLGGRIYGVQLDLVYDAKVIPRAEAEALFEDHLFRLEQLAARLDHYPHKITSYVYGSPEQKRLLMGAGQVYIAKPWLDEIHLNRVPYGHSVITHELAHIVLSRYAPWPLHIPTAGVLPIPQMALVEGAAEAFEWDTGALTPHEWACAMRSAKLAPSLGSLLRADGFYQQSSDKAYTLAGSFIRWLIDTHGSARFEALYRDGDFEGVYGRPRAALVGDWERFVDALVVPEDAAGLATGRYTQVAIFYRPCGLDVARTEAEAARLAGAGDRAGARRLYEQVVGWLPADPQKRMPLLQLAVADNDRALAAVRFASYMGLPAGRNPASDAQATELVADLLWRGGQRSEASALYASIVDTPAAEDRRRTVLVKAWVASHEGLHDVLDYLLDGQLATLERVRAAHPDEPLVDYLVGRRRATDQRHADALPLLEAALATMPADPAAPWIPWVRRETWRLLAMARFRAERYADAAVAFEMAATLTPYGGDRDRHLDWAERMRWKIARAPKN